MIAIACDHAAIALKNQIIAHLKGRGEALTDCGGFSDKSVDYPDFALKAALLVAKGECTRGILICGTGIGMSIAANKVRGIRCAHCTDEISAAMARQHNNANMIALGARITAHDTALRMVDIFLNTPFSDEPRHAKRVRKIMDIEENRG
ncbi:MAG: ribose 5-phosphate isomerase B [Firmicutes bacterium]|nr:ribose 5-phosphate isomerase B [Bacillota bacterium]